MSRLGLLCVAPFAVYPSTRDRVILVSSGTGRAIEIPVPLVGLLQCCRGAKTFDEHLASMPGVGDASKEHALRTALETLMVMGLLRSGSVEAVSPGASVERTPREITTIGVVTADRPAMLQRCLSSLVRQCEMRNRRPRFAVIDGSKTADNSVANSRAVARVSALGRHAVTYVGPVEAHRIARELGAMAGDESSLLSGLASGTVGANRNLLQLITAGEHVLMVDDDVVCTPWVVGSASERVLLAGHEEFRHVRFFSSRPDAVAATQRADIDLLGEHERLLGRSLHAVLAESTEPDVQGACEEVLAGVQRGAQSIIRVTFAGIAGDSGVSCPRTMLLAGGTLRSELASSAETYRTAMRSREVVRVAPGLAVSHEPHYMATCMAIANTGSLPPFLPVGQNEDGVFGTLLAYRDPLALFGHVPMGVLHDSHRPAPYDQLPPLSASQVRMVDIVHSLLPARSPELPSNNGWALRRFGEELVDLASVEPGDFRDTLVRRLAKTRAGVLSAIERQMSRFPHPEYLRADLEGYRDTLIASMARPRFFAPVECRDAGSLVDAFQETQAHVGRFGRLIAAWPALWEAALDRKPNRVET